MAVKRIVADIAAGDVSKAAAFYGDLLGLDVVMDQGWIKTFAAPQMAPIQISVASEGGSGTPVPDLSIEVDAVDETYRKAKEAGFEIAYELTDEPWGVRRFYVRDPFGKLVNILSHLAEAR
jgi:catechol 2,3-dioxygenase-like lactoylglutathione lyase family enzyme